MLDDDFAKTALPAYKDLLSAANMSTSMTKHHAGATLLCYMIKGSAKHGAFEALAPYGKSIDERVTCMNLVKAILQCIASTGGLQELMQNARFQMKPPEEMLARKKKKREQFGIGWKTEKIPRSLGLACASAPWMMARQSCWG